MPMEPEVSQGRGLLVFCSCALLYKTTYSSLYVYCSWSRVAFRLRETVYTAGPCAQCAMSSIVVDIFFTYYYSYCWIGV